jgi:outer membrane autotransporter protein
LEPKITYGTSSVYLTLILAYASAIDALKYGQTPADDPNSYGAWSDQAFFAQSAGLTPLQYAQTKLKAFVATVVTSPYFGLGLQLPTPYTPLYVLHFAPEHADTFFPDDIALAYASVLKAPPPLQPAPFAQRWTSWAVGFGGSSKNDGTSATTGNALTTRAAGGIGGLEYLFSPQTKLGFALGGTGANWDIGAAGSARADAFQYAIYGRTGSGPAYLTGWVSAGDYWTTSNRLAGGGDNVTASYTASGYGGRLEAGYGYAALPLLVISPYAAVRVQYFHTPNYSEIDISGGGMGVSYNAENVTDTRSELGARFDNTQVFSSGALLELNLRVAWAHDWVSNPAATGVYEAAPLLGFSISGVPLPTDSALTTVKAELRNIGSQWSLVAQFDGQFASSFHMYAGTTGLRYAW